MEFIERLIARKSLTLKETENKSNKFHSNNDNHEASTSLSTKTSAKQTGIDRYITIVKRRRSSQPSNVSNAKKVLKPTTEDNRSSENRFHFWALEAENEPKPTIKVKSICGN